MGLSYDANTSLLVSASTDTTICVWKIEGVDSETPDTSSALIRCVPCGSPIYCLSEMDRNGMIYAGMDNGYFLSFFQVIPHIFVN